jgi:hypothetical protein
MIRADTILSALPEAKNKSFLIEKDQSVPDIITLISVAHKRYASYYDFIANFFYDSDTYKTCASLFEFCKKQISYNIEASAEQNVRSPQMILQYGEGDCKHYASFIAGVLDALKRKGYPVTWSYRFTGYDSSMVPGHVFVVVNDKEGEIWVDPVMDYLDERKTPTVKQDMSVKTLGNCNRCKKIGSIGDTTDAGKVALVGKTIMAIAPIAATVPGAGWFVAAGIEVLGTLIGVASGLFDKWSASSNVRWLVADYEYFVLGHCGVHSDNTITSEQYAAAASAWFALITGIPIYDRYRWFAIKGRGVGTSVWNDVRGTKQDRMHAYYDWPETKGVPMEAVSRAIDIAEGINYTDGCGGWKDVKPANVQLQPAATSSSASASTIPVLSSLTGNSILPLALLAVGGFLLLND